MNNTIKEVLFEFVEGENDGVELRVTPHRTLIIGRSEECDIYLSEKKISRRHTEMIVSKENIIVKDLGSTNGTFVNKKKVSEQEITSSDRIQVGTTVIKVTVFFETAQKEEPQRSTDPKYISLSHTQPRPKSLLHESPSGLMDPLPHVTPKPMLPLQEQDFIEKNDPEQAPPPQATSEPAPVELEQSFSKTAHLTPAKPKNISDDDFVEEKSKPLSGSLSAMALADLLQTFWQNHKSGFLKISSRTNGSLVLFEGKIVSAHVGFVKGEKALYRMLGWSSGNFELLPLNPDFDLSKIESPINDSTENLLMEGFRQFDELEKIKSKLPPSETLTLCKPLNAPLSKLHPRVLDIVQLILNTGNSQEVLDQSPFTDLETTKILVYLFQKNYIQQT